MSIKRYYAGCEECVEEEATDGYYVLYADHAAELTMVEWQRDANRRMLNKALKDNAILRAECEAWRRWKDGYHVLYADHAADGAMLAARAATDAAGILKGGVQ